LPLVATKLRANPALLDEARENLMRWQKMDRSPRLALSEWESICAARLTKSRGSLRRDPKRRPGYGNPAPSPAR